MTRTGIRATLLAALAATALAVAGATPTASAKSKVPGLQFLGQAIVPTGTQFAGTTVGGLSSITYDARRGVYYTISDDQANVRYYTVGLDVGDGQLTNGDVHFLGVTSFKGPDGQPFATGTVDPEGLAYVAKDGTLVATSEGFSNRLIDPWVRRFALDGSQIGTLPVPAPFLPNAAGTRGVRLNLAFESAGIPPNGRFLFTATENALVQDGPAATTAGGSPSRILRYDLQTGKLDRQWVYWTDPVAQAPIPPTQFSVNGVVELLPLNNQFLIAMERSFSVGVPGTGNTIKLYSVRLPGATNVNGADSLAGSLGSVRTAQKTLLLNLDSLGIPLDNVEGLTLGPKLPDGRQSLVLVSDNNFAASQFTQFLLFAIDKH